MQIPINIHQQTQLSVLETSQYVIMYKEYIRSL